MTFMIKENLLVLCKCFLFTHRAPQNSQGGRSKVSVRSRSNWNLKMLIFVEEGKPEYPEKNRRKVVLTIASYARLNMLPTIATV